MVSRLRLALGCGGGDMENPVTKPIVFLSHSSRDQAILKRLKDALVDKTGGSIDIFLSCDGQSIPLGRNWVHRVEEALDHCKLMLTFISPQSINSSWVFFESGYSYAKGIRVVPVGVAGVDLAKLPPPLGLLQGFNITSEDGLNNIIEVVNKSFDHSHKDVFVADDYRAIFGASVAEDRSGLEALASIVKEIVFKLKGNQKDMLREIRAILTGRSMPFQETDEGVNAFGLSVLNDGEGQVRVAFDPLAASTALPALDDILEHITTSTPGPHPFSVMFERAVQHLVEHHRVSARLVATGACLGQGSAFTYKGIEFEIQRQCLMFLDGARTWKNRSGVVYIDGKYVGGRFGEAPLAELIQLLFEKQILFLTEGPISER